MSQHTKQLAETCRYLHTLEQLGVELIQAWDDLNNPNIRVGPVFPRMEILRKELGITQPPHMRPDQ